MKVRITLMTENNVPLEELGDNPEDKIKLAWEIYLQCVSAGAENEDKAYVESVEVL